MKTTSTNFLKLALAVLLFSNAAFIFCVFQYQKQQNAKFTELHKKLDVIIKNNSETQSEKDICLQVFLGNEETQELEVAKIDYVREVLIDNVEEVEPIEPIKIEEYGYACTMGENKPATMDEGIEYLYQYIHQNLKYPKKAIKQGVEGKVLVKFVVDKNGEITDVEATNDIGGGCAEEAKRVIKNSPKWNPARQRGKKVKTTMRIPIVFNLE